MYDNNYLQHYGIKGMKWGVRRYQNKDGSLTPAGKKRYDDDTSTSSAKNETSKSKSVDRYKLAKKLADGKLDAEVKDDKLYKEWDKKSNELYEKYGPKSMKDMYIDPSNPGAGLTDAYKKYERLYDEAYDEYRNKTAELRKEIQNERNNARKELFFNDDVKTDMHEARNIRQKLNSIEKATIDENSEYAHNAYKKYAEKYGDNDDSAYGFYHYRWREGNPEYDAAYKEYQKQSKDLSKAYNDKTIEIGKKVFGEYADKNVFGSSRWGKQTYAEYGRDMAKELIQWHNELFDD